MIKAALKAVEDKYYATRPTFPDFQVGDTVDVHVKIKEGDRERVQVFNGTVIGRRGRGASEMFTVRRIVNDEGVERTWPLLCPAIDKIDVKRRGKVRRAKLYYLRDRVGKATKVKELRVSREQAAKKQAKNA
jgi:large subunit ribosomal protein L19